MTFRRVLDVEMKEATRMGLTWIFVDLMQVVNVHILVVYATLTWERNRVFSLTWSASMQIYWKKRKRLHKKRVQLPQDWFGTPTWPPFHCFGTKIWPPWRHVKTLLYCFSLGIQKNAGDVVYIQWLVVDLNDLRLLFQNRSREFFLQ